MDDSIAIRGASRDDATDLAALLAHLGYPADPTTVIARLGQLETTGLDQVFVAEDQDGVIGVAVLHITPALLHRPGPVARITALVVAAQHERRGIGRRLVAAVEELASAAGCAAIEVSSNERRSGAHAFYHALGYEANRHMFRKTLAAPAE